MIQLYETIEGLEALLRERSIPTSFWGAGKAKSVEHLFEELRMGEAVLVLNQDGRLLRVTRVVGLNITKQGYVLQEQFQLFYKDGRRRTRRLDSSTGEKLFLDETPEKGVRRLIETEFPVLLLQPQEDVKSVREETREAESESYPGLITRYHVYYFTVELVVELPPFTVQETDKLVGYDWVKRS